MYFNKWGRKNSWKNRLYKWKSTKKQSEGICNYDNNNNFIQSNIYRPHPEFNQDFAFSPVNSLKEPLNEKENGSEVVINNSKGNINQRKRWYTIKNDKNVYVYNVIFELASWL